MWQSVTRGVALFSGPGASVTRKCGGSVTSMTMDRFPPSRPRPLGKDSRPLLTRHDIKVLRSWIRSDTNPWRVKTLTANTDIHPSYAAALDAIRAWNALPASVRIAVIEQGAALPVTIADWPKGRP